MSGCPRSHAIGWSGGASSSHATSPVVSPPLELSPVSVPVASPPLDVPLVDVGCTSLVDSPPPDDDSPVLPAGDPPHAANNATRASRDECLCIGAKTTTPRPRQHWGHQTLSTTTATARRSAE